MRVFGRGEVPYGRGATGLTGALPGQGALKRIVQEAGPVPAVAPAPCGGIHRVVCTQNAARNSNPFFQKRHLS